MGFFFKSAVPPRGGFPEVAPAPHEQKKDVKLSDFEILDTLGTGTFGRTRLVRHIHENRFYALKMVKKSTVMQMNQLQHMKCEVRLLRTLCHPFIVRLHANFQDELRLYILMEFVMGGEIYALLRNSKTFANDQAKFYAAEIVLALEYLHSMHVVYRALKPENVLLDCEGHAKLIDFGFAKVVLDRTWTQCGTPEYLAPEVIANDGHAKSVDWWALGVLIYEMLCGYPPYSGATPMATYEKILSGKFQVPDSVDGKAANAIKHLLQKDRTKRLGCQQGGADAVKGHGWFARINWDSVYYCQCKTPHRPELSSVSDTRHFDQYPDSDPGIEEPLTGKGMTLFRDLE